ncbi:MAG: hypothetical protein JXA67_06995, partial [Micromonosporaceae bacterium]|nr:hypothetical protein [Micromonosporaceae bacterium]
LAGDRIPRYRRNGWIVPFDHDWHRPKYSATACWSPGCDVADRAGNRLRQPASFACDGCSRHPHRLGRWLWGSDTRSEQECDRSGTTIDSRR